MRRNGCLDGFRLTVTDMLVMRMCLDLRVMWRVIVSEYQVSVRILIMVGVFDTP